MGDTPPRWGKPAKTGHFLEELLPAFPLESHRPRVLQEGTSVPPSTGTVRSSSLTPGSAHGFGPAGGRSVCPAEPQPGRPDSTPLPWSWGIPAPLANPRPAGPARGARAPAQPAPAHSAPGGDSRRWVGGTFPSVPPGACAVSDRDQEGLRGPGFPQRVPGAELTSWRQPCSALGPRSRPHDAPDSGGRGLTLLADAQPATRNSDPAVVRTPGTATPSGTIRNLPRGPAQETAWALPCVTSLGPNQGSARGGGRQAARAAGRRGARRRRDAPWRAVPPHPHPPSWGAGRKGRKPKGHRFTSQPGHRPGLQTRPPGGVVREATTRLCFSPSLSLSRLKMGK